MLQFTEHGPHSAQFWLGWEPGPALRASSSWQCRGRGCLSCSALAAASLPAPVPVSFQLGGLAQLPRTPTGLAPTAPVAPGPGGAVSLLLGWDPAVHGAVRSQDRALKSSQGAPGKLGSTGERRSLCGQVTASPRSSRAGPGTTGGPRPLQEPGPEQGQLVPEGV